jgi:hypothetical protein
VTHNWIITNERTGESYTRTTKYVDDFVFPTWGKWKLDYTKKDGCGEKQNVRYLNIQEKFIDVDIDVFDDNCTGTNAGCRVIKFENDEDDGDDTFDFDGTVNTSCML